MDSWGSNTPHTQTPEAQGQPGSSEEGAECLERTCSCHPLGSESFLGHLVLCFQVTVENVVVTSIPIGSLQLCLQEPRDRQDATGISKPTQKCPQSRSWITCAANVSGGEAGYLILSATAHLMSVIAESSGGRLSFVCSMTDCIQWSLKPTTLATAIVFIILLLYSLDLSQPESAKQLV